MSGKVDRIIAAKKVYTLNPSAPEAECIAIHQGRIVAVGNRSDLRSAYTAKEFIDLENAIIYPGFMDPHSHFLSYGLILQRAWLFGSPSWEEAIDRLIAHRRKTNASSDTGQAAWIQGRGWDQNLWPGREFPNRDLLDKAFPREKVLAIRVDGHAAVANGAALEAAGIGPDTHIDGGTVVMSGGVPSGLLLDNAVDRVREAIPQPDDATLRRALLEAQSNCLKVGLTAVSNAGTEHREALFMKSMIEEESLRLGLYVMLMPTESNIEEFVQRGPLSTERLSVRSFKMFADGALGSRGAYLLKPYSDDPENYGLKTLEPEELARICRIARESGFQMNVHAIGDAGVRMVLDIFEDFLPPANDLRWRIEHAQVVDDIDLPRFRRLGVIPSIQTCHATSDMAWTEKRLGQARMPKSHRYRDLLAQHGWLANGSDFPIEAIDPLRGFRAAVFSQDDSGLPEPGYLPDQCISREAALKAMTIWAAKANFEEKNRGSIEPGKLADFTALDVDLLQDTRERVREARVVATILGGSVMD